MVKVSSAKGLILEWFLGSEADLRESIIPFCELIKSSFIVPLLRVVLHICFFLSFLLSIEWFLMLIPAIIAKLFLRNPERKYKWETIKEDMEIGSASFPMVLVQIPIFNEIEVYKFSIGAACNLSWPADRLVIQILDDSTDIFIKDMIEKECKKWACEGINIRYQYRETRKGQKAGALKDGLEHEYVKECEYVAIFDADFQPEPDFLQRAIPFLIHNTELALVQARWSYVNADECFLTRMQEMSLDYMFRIEEEGGSALCNFFSFNGSAGIWRIAAIVEAGGWKDRTTVEDMDLAVRAGLKRWKFFYLDNLQVKSELPSNFTSYRSQQHRWFAGPASLFRKMVIEIAKSKEVSVWKKVFIIYDFFFARKIIGNTFSFLFFCIVIPLATVFPEVNLPKWESILITLLIASLNTAITTPRSIHLALPWILFENVLSFHRMKAIFIGLFQGKRAREWIVTEKLGDALTNKANNQEQIIPKKPARLDLLKNRLLVQELVLAVFFLMCGSYGLFYRKDSYGIYLFLQAIFYTIAGFGYFGTQVPSS